MLYRKKEKIIRDWLSNSDKAMLITGARQVGKTYLIEHVLDTEGADYIKFNLIEQPEVVELFDEVGDLGIEVFISRLTLLADKPLEKGRTVIFIDEVQRCKELVTKIKFLVEEGSFKYIFSGSLLGVELHGMSSAPVGFLHTVEMYPLDLEEFLIALSVQNETLSGLRKCFEEKTEVDPFIHKKIMEAFQNYMVVGGMPEAVQTYVESNDFNRVIGVHNTIIPQYRLDFTQYEEVNNRLKLIKTYDLVPAELNEKNKRYNFSHLDKEFKAERYVESFEWLINAGVVIPVYNVTEPVVPLLANEKSNLFKLFLSDVGMLSTIYGRTMILKTLRGDSDINFGAAYENFVAQELNAHGYKGYYFNSKKQGEVDFLIEYEDKVLPIEVKSGKSYKKHSALSNILSNKAYSINQGIVLCNDNVQKEGNIYYLPIYMTMFLDEKEQPIPKFEPINLANL